MSLVKLLSSFQTKRFLPAAERDKVVVTIQPYARLGLGYAQFTRGRKNVLVRVASARSQIPRFSLESHDGFVKVASKKALMDRISEALGCNVVRPVKRRKTSNGLG